ncbi:hypothetical protein B0A52_02645 [Exophiala mesophila]|uniref:Uncharacterized protein n=1 Tax=Exophiala mesophila TaxID=212818 RepID=A0A438NDM1_EXOME|nr:hypothetical protein B0A52_02645 [Exophiala mesophila]
MLESIGVALERGTPPERLKIDLEEAATLLHCSRYHRPQAPGKVEEWVTDIDISNLIIPVIYGSHFAEKVSLYFHKLFHYFYSFEFSTTVSTVYGSYIFDKVSLDFDIFFQPHLDLVLPLPLSLSPVFPSVLSSSFYSIHFSTTASTTSWSGRKTKFREYRHCSIIIT